MEFPLSKVLPYMVLLIYKESSSVTLIINSLSDDVMFINFHIPTYKFGFKLQITFRLPSYSEVVTLIYSQNMHL